MRFYDTFHNGTILITIVLLVFIYPVAYEASLTHRAQEFKTQMEDIVDKSCDDAVRKLLQTESDDSMEIMGEGHRTNFKTMELNLDASLDRFYDTLFINMGIVGDKAEQDAIKFKFPIKVVVTYDGYYINAFDKNNGEIVCKWFPKKEFLYQPENYDFTVKVTLDDTVYIRQKGDNDFKEHKASELKGKYNDKLFTDKFNEVRVAIINKYIKEDLEFYTAHCNEVGQALGKCYAFQIPQYDDRSIDDISFIAFMQGDPVRGMRDYNVYGFGASRLVRHGYYYGGVTDGERFYHTDSCKDRSKANKIFDNAQQAASQGYKPHRECIPH